MPGTDYYKTLGVDKNATQDEIKNETSSGLAIIDLPPAWKEKRHDEGHYW